jgi:hypothetical protein
MKKFFSLLILSVMTLSWVSPTLAADDYHLSDQRQLEGASCLTAYSGYYRNQTLQVTHNVLTMVGFKMKNMNGGNVTVTVKDETTGDTVLSATQRMGTDEGWMEFDLVDDALGYLVDPDHTFSIWVGTDYYSGTDAPCWVYSNTDVYDYGTRRQGTTEQTGDMTFYTTGYTIDMGRENPETPDPEEEEEETVMVVDTEEETIDDTSIEDTNNDESAPENVPDEAQDVEDVEIGTIDESVTSPTLGNVIVNDVLVELVENGTEVNTDDVVKITGTADAGDTVVIFIGDSVYTSVVDDDGNWFVVVTFDEDATVYGQSTNDEDMASEKVELFDMSILSSSTEVEADTLDTTTTSTTFLQQLLDLVPEGPWGYVVYAILGIFFSGLIFLLILLLKRRKNKEGEEKKKTV